MTSFVRDTSLIAGFDLRESLRTRRALVLIVLYLVCSTVSSLVYVQTVRLAEKAMSQATQELARGAQGVKGAAGAGLAVGLLKSEGYRSVLKFVAGGDESVASYLASFPPMVLIFTWCSLAFLPWLIALTSYDQVAGDLHLRTVRYTALRTHRFAFVAGKLAAQLLLVAGIATLGMAPVVIVGWTQLDSFEPIPTITSLLSTAPVTLAYAAAFVGAVSLASQLCRTPGAARAAAIGLLLVLWILAVLGPGGRGSDAPLWRMLAAPFAYLSPWTYKASFFRPELATRAGASLACVALCAFYVGLGFLRFRSRDI
jgi:ABC-type transport system involved in multi-copper enzyme maturation permease subunit